MKQSGILHTIMENTDAHLAFLDYDFNFVVVNAAYAKGSGYEKSDLIGRNHFDLFPDQENQQIFEFVRESGEPVEFREKPFVYPDAPERGITYWNWRLTPVKAKCGSVEGLVFSLVDVTDQVRSRKLSATLTQLNAHINSTFLFEKVASDIMEEAGQALDCSTAWLALREGKNWVVKYGYGLPDYLVGSTISHWEAPVACLSANSKRSLTVGDIYDNKDVTLLLNDGRETRAFLSAPIVIRDEAIGVISFNYHISKVFTGAQAAFVETLANSIAMSLANLELYNKIKEQNQRLEAVVNIRTRQLERTNELLRLFTIKRSRKEYMDSVVELLAKWTACEKVSIKVFKTMSKKIEGSTLRSEMFGNNCNSNIYQTEIIIPITYQGSVLGAIFIADEKQKFLSDTLIHFIQSMAPLIGEAVQKFNLEEQNRRTYETLLLSEERFARSFNASPNPMALLTLDEGRFLEANQAFLVYVGYENRALIGRTQKELCLFEESIDHETLAAQLKLKGSLRNLEIEFEKEAGEIYTGLLSAESVDLNGQKCVLIVVNDITARRKMELEMARLDRLNLVGEMAAGIGHEIRNPMTTARGFLQLLQEKDINQQNQGYFELIIDELDRANGIITEFLSMAKNRPVVAREQDLNQIIKAIFSLISADALLMNNLVEVRLGDLPKLLLDEKEMRQLLLNLVRNGLEAMPLGGTLLIETYLEPLEDKVVLLVKDEGTGIDPSLAGKIGTPFFTTKEKGTGLGLAICYSIAQRHGAKVSYKSNNTGTTFFVEFPLRNQTNSISTSATDKTWLQSGPQSRKG